MANRGESLGRAIHLLFVWALAACQGVSGGEALGGNTAQALQSAPVTLLPENLGTPTGVSLRLGLGAVSWGPGRIDVFARDTSGAVWQKWFSGSWQPWASLGWSSSSPVAASSWASGRLDLFYRDPSTNRLHQRHYDQGAWADDGLVGASIIPSDTLSAASWAPNRIDVFMRGASSELRHIWYANGWINDWVTEVGTSGGVNSAPSAVAWAANRLDVFWREGSSNRLQHWWYDGALHLSPLGGATLASNPAAASRGTGLLDVFYLSGDNPSTLERRIYDSSWLGEEFDLAGAQGPAIASGAPGRLDLFYQDTNNALVHSMISGPPMLTQHGDNARTGANLHEIELNTVNVASSKFGRLFDIPVDGNVYAQPLYAPAVDLRAQGSGIVNALYIATANNSVYMANADTGQILKQLSFKNPVPVPFSDFTPGSGGVNACLYNMLPQVGITSTPVIDLPNQTLYVVSLRADTPLSPEAIPQTCPATKGQSTFHYRVMLHALNMTTLAERSGSPVEVNPSATGGFTFDARRQLQRPGLLLSSGKVYLAFGSYTDATPYTGWVLSYSYNYSTGSFVPVDKFVTTPNGTMGGIWQAGQGPAADSQGNLYFLTGNASDDTSSAPNSNRFATAALKLNSGLQFQSCFIPWNHAFLNAEDVDLGSSGIMLVPGTNYALGGGKESILYLMDRTNLGGMNNSADQVVYEDQVTFANPDCGGAPFSNIHGTPVFWQSPAGPRFYLWGEEDFLREYALSSAAFSPVARSATARAGCGMPGGFLTVSAYNSTPGTGIVWGTIPSQDGLAAVVPGSVHAFDAETLRELWSAAIDTAGEHFAKNNPPTVANGKVYVAAFGPAGNVAGSLNSSYSGKVIVYGLTQK
jgi:hypothetical protein